MGYSTYFTGTLKFKEPITKEQETLLDSISGIDCRDGHPFVGVHCPNISYIDFEINEDKLGIEHCGAEKSYNTVEQVNFIIDVMKSQYPNFALEGGLLAQGEEVGDIWKLVIEDGEAIRVDIKIENLNIKDIIKEINSLTLEARAKLYKKLGVIKKEDNKP